MANEFSTLLYKHIDRRELTDVAFATRVGVAKSTVSKLRNKAPSLKTLAALDRWAAVLRLDAAQRQELVEAAHLARSTEIVQGLVDRLRRQLSQAGDYRIALEEQSAVLEDLLRSKGIQIPKIGNDLSPGV